MSEWISVEERLPELFEDVLTYCINVSGETYALGERYMAVDRLVKWNDGYRTCFRTDRFFGEVTHWMPLPKEPKEV